MLKAFSNIIIRLSVSYSIFRLIANSIPFEKLIVYPNLNRPNGFSLRYVYKIEKLMPNSLSVIFSDENTFNA